MSLSMKDDTKWYKKVALPWFINTGTLTNKVLDNISLPFKPQYLKWAKAPFETE